MSLKEHVELMQTLDDAWNNQDWETFKRHHALNVRVYWRARRSTGANPRTRRTLQRISGVLQDVRQQAGKQPIQDSVWPR